MSLIDPASCSPARALFPDNLLASAYFPVGLISLDEDDVDAELLRLDAAFFWSPEILPASRSCWVITGSASKATLSICAVNPSAAA